MTGFYIAIILFGAFISAIALVLVFADKNREHDYRLDVTERRNALVDAMDDAETLVGEMNRFADYVATQCEDKRHEVEETIRRADRLVSQVSDACAVLESRLAATRTESAPAGNTAEIPVARADTALSGGSNGMPQAMQPVTETEAEAEAGVDAMLSASASGMVSGIPAADVHDGGVFGMPEDPVSAVNRGRVLPLHSRRAEVLRLARRGMSHAEIAKALHMGKGEIELIARIGSGT